MVAIPTQGSAAQTGITTEQRRLTTWLAKRQSLLAIYWKLSGLSAAFEKENPSAEELAWFSQALVDYLAEGHFVIYTQLIEDINAHLPEAQPQINFLYSSLLNSTNSLVDISDETAKMTIDEFVAKHDTVLAHFGHDWAHHLEMEDNLIKYWQEANDAYEEPCDFVAREGS